MERLKDGYVELFSLFVVINKLDTCISYEMMFIVSVKPK